MDFMIRSENGANVDTSIITSPWQRSDSHKAEVAKRLTLCKSFVVIAAVAAAAAA